MRIGRAIALLTLLLTGTSWAEAPRQYFGLSGSDALFVPENGQKEDLGNINAKLGYQVNSFVGVELHMGQSVSTSSTNIDNPSLGYVSPMLRLTLPYDRVNIYSLFGLASVRADLPSNANDNYSDFSMGLGLELYSSKRTALSLEYMRYGVDDTYKTFGLGVVHYFEWPSVRNPRFER